MITKDDSRQRWISTVRTAVAGAVLGSIGGAITAALSLLGDQVWTPSQSLLIGLFYGAPFGALLGAVLGVVSGALGGCLAMHVVRRHAVLARALLAVCCGVSTAAAAWWSLPPGPAVVVGTVLATATAVVAAWTAAPWCFRPLRKNRNLTG